VVLQEATVFKKLALPSGSSPASAQRGAGGAGDRLISTALAQDRAARTPTLIELPGIVHVFNLRNAAFQPGNTLCDGSNVLRILERSDFLLVLAAFKVAPNLSVPVVRNVIITNPNRGRFTSAAARQRVSMGPGVGFRAGFSGTDAKCLFASCKIWINF
jgi:hypothetical protein